MNSRVIASGAMCALLGAALAGVAFAGGVPATNALTWGGTVTDDSGKPLGKTVNVSVSFYASATGGTALCSSASASADAKTGRFAVTLPASCAKAVHENAELWSETVADGKTLPRVKVGAVPFALEAGVAASAGGALKTQLANLSGDVAGNKAAVVGLNKDVAALKSGSGSSSGGSSGGGAAGSLYVKDASGALMGSVLDWEVSWVEVLTSTGHVARIRLEGYLNTKASYVYFTAKGCAGDAFLPGTGASARHVYISRLGGKLVYYVPKGSLDSVSVAQSFALYSTLVGDGTCKNSTSQNPSTSSNRTALVEKTGPSVGLPTTISFPLKVVSQP